VTALRLAVIMAAMAVAGPAQAHSWYQNKTDPVYLQSCCGILDCAAWAIQPNELTAEEHGYRVRLSLERTKLINPLSQSPIDALVIWERVQPSEDGNWHLCLMSSFRDDARGGIYCLFMPPNG